MMVVVDCGNSRLKWARVVDGALIARAGISLAGDEGDPFEALAAAIDPAACRVLVANVAGREAADRIARAVHARAGIAPDFVTAARTAAGIDNGYRDPAQLGVDRWLAMLACRAEFAGAFVVVAAGTAVTIDAVSAAGQHQGGLILPGDRLMITALAANTGQIDLVPRAGEQPAGLGLLGRSTAEAVGHGARLAIAAAIDRAVDRVAPLIGDAAAVVLTGGDARALEGWLETTVAVRADLVLEGLAILSRAEE